MKKTLLQSLLLLLLLGSLPAAAQERIRLDSGARLTAYLPTQANGTAVVVCPGGSYCWLDKQTEGRRVAEHLQAEGYAAFVLEYHTIGWFRWFFHTRVLTGKMLAPRPLDDAAAALAYVRSNADRLGIAADRVGIMGFSAGGHLALWAAERLSPESGGPNFCVSVYPVVSLSHPAYTHRRSRRALLGERHKRDARWQQALSLERHADDVQVPVMLVNCKDDPVVDYQNSELMDAALTTAAKPHVYLQYDAGGHGFGCESASAPWFPRFVEWERALFQK